MSVKHWAVFIWKVLEEEIKVQKFYIIASFVTDVSKHLNGISVYIGLKIHFPI